MVRSLSVFVKLVGDDSLGFSSVWGAGETVEDSPGESVSGAASAASLNAARDCSAVLEFRVLVFEKNNLMGWEREREKKKKKEGENARIDDTDKTLLAVSALGTVEKYWIWMSDVDSECDDLDQTDINTTGLLTRSQNRRPNRFGI